MTSRTPCLAGLRPLSCSCLLTIWGLLRIGSRSCELRGPTVLPQDSQGLQMASGFSRVAPRQAPRIIQVVYSTAALNQEVVHAHLQIWKRGHECLSSLGDRTLPHSRGTLINAEPAVR